MKYRKTKRSELFFRAFFPLKKSSGFTLLELIISMTIVAVIVVIIFGAFRIGIKAWEKGENDIESHQRLRIVLELINRQMASITFKDVKRFDKEQPLLKGDGKNFEFASHVAMAPTNKFGLVYVKYSISENENGGEKLLAFEKNFVLFDQDFNFDDIAPDDFIELMPNATEIYFEYLKPPEQGLEDEPQWLESWDPEIEKEAPIAVRFTVVQDPEKAPIVVIAQVHQDRENT